MARGPEPTVITLTKRQRDESETVASDEGARPRLRQRARIGAASTHRAGGRGRARQHGGSCTATRPRQDDPRQRPPARSQYGCHFAAASSLNPAWKERTVLASSAIARLTLGVRHPGGTPECLICLTVIARAESMDEGRVVKPRKMAVDVLEIAVHEVAPPLVDEEHSVGRDDRITARALLPPREHVPGVGTTAMKPRLHVPAHMMSASLGRRPSPGLGRRCVV